MYTKYSYEEYYEPCLRYYCRRYGIKQHSYLYQECYEAGMLGYWYSMARCCIIVDLNDMKRVKAYLWKVTKGCVIAAMVVAYDSRNLCRVNGFKEISVDSYKV